MNIEINFVGERLVNFRGKKQKFYLFKISGNTEESEESYLGVAGPYDPGTKELVVYAGDTDLVWDEPYSKAQIETQFKKHLSQMESYYKELGKR